MFDLLNKRKVKKILAKGEIITVGEFIKRYTDSTMSPFGMDIFYKCYIMSCSFLKVYNNKYPIKVERKR